MNAPLELIPVYREGKFDKRYWYTERVKRYLRSKRKRLAAHIKQYLSMKGSQFVHRTNLLFEQQSFTTTKY